MNEAIQVLRKRQAVELEALSAVTVAVSVVERARQRRAAEVERLDAVVTDAERGADVALAVLASLMSVDVAAGLVQVPAVRVRQAQQHAPVDEVGDAGAGADRNHGCAGGASAGPSAGAGERSPWPEWRGAGYIIAGAGGVIGFGGSGTATGHDWG